jgi:uncharacterized CHY-type Zn-finger protein
MAPLHRGRPHNRSVSNIGRFPPNEFGEQKKSPFQFLFQVFKSSSVIDVTRLKYPPRESSADSFASFASCSTAPEDMRHRKSHQNTPKTYRNQELEVFGRLADWDIERLRRMLGSLSQIENALDSDTTPRLKVDEAHIKLNLKQLTREFGNAVRPSSTPTPLKAERLDLYRQLSDRLYRLWEKNSRQIFYSCVVCGDDKEDHYFHTFVTLNCSHPSRCCKGCLSSWTTAQLETQGWNFIKCPECPQVLKRDDIREAATRETYER